MINGNVFMTNIEDRRIRRRYRKVHELGIGYVPRSITNVYSIKIFEKDIQGTTDSDKIRQTENVN